MGTPVPTITIAPGTSPVTEGTAAQFTVTADFAPTTNLPVNLTVSESADSDYLASADEGGKTVTITSGNTTTSYSVPTQDDSSPEPNGMVTLSVSAGTGYNVGPVASASVTINDDDAPGRAGGVRCSRVLKPTDYFGLVHRHTHHSRLVLRHRRLQQRLRRSGPNLQFRGHDGPIGR